MFNLISEQKLNARFFIQNITQVDTYFSIKHWFSMQKALNDYSTASTSIDPQAINDASAQPTESISISSVQF
jgi:hypothetical protein